MYLKGTWKQRSVHANEFGPAAQMELADHAEQGKSLATEEELSRLARPTRVSAVSDKKT